MASDKSTSKISTFIDTKYAPLDKKIKIFVCLILFILPVVLFYFSFYSPNVKKINGYIAKKKGLVAEIAKAEKAASELGKIQAEIAATEELFKETAKLSTRQEIQLPASIILRATFHYPHRLQSRP